MYKVLFVCTLNVSRSPLAEGICGKVCAERGLQNDFYIDSAGIEPVNTPNRLADPLSVKIAAKYGIDLSPHRSRGIEDRDFKKFDYILAIDQYHLQCLQELCPSHLQNKLFLLMSFSNNQEFKGTALKPPSSLAEAEDLYLRIESACQGLIESML